MSIESRRDNLKNIMREELPFTFGKGAVESIIGLDETNYELNIDNNSRILKLENNETIFQVFSYVGTSPSGQVPVYEESSIFDIYGDGVVDAIAVKADDNQNPIEEVVIDSLGERITVTALTDNLNNTANFTLSGTPTEAACIIYFLKIKDEFKSNIPEDNIIPPAINVKVKNTNVLTVDKNGGDFITIEAALASITDNSSVNRYTIEVTPGIYIENNPLPLKNYVTIKSIGTNLNVNIEALNVAENLFESEGTGYSFLIDLALSEVGSGYAAIHVDTAMNVICRGITIINCDRGFYLNNANGELDLVEIQAIAFTSTIDKMILVDAGKATVTQYSVTGDSNVNVSFEINGATSSLLGSGFSSFSSNMLRGMTVSDGARVIVSNAQAENSYDGVVVTGSNCNVSFTTLNMLNCQNDALRVENVGTGIVITMFVAQVIGSGNLNFNILNPNCIVSGSGITELDKGFIISGAQFYAYLLDTQGGGEGLSILGELHVGTPERPTESAFGGGDSYTRGMVVYTYDGTSVYTNVSESARSVSSSTFTFPSINTNSAIYIASSLENGDKLHHFGIKSLVTTAAVLGAGNIVTEYYNGVAWVELGVMETESSGKYFPYAKNIFQHTGSYQLRYDAYLANDDWTKTDLPGFGVDLFWIRFRITSIITTAPIFEQFKLHTNRSEINKDGWIEYFGKARPINQLPLNFTTSKPFEGNMQSQTIYVSEDIGVGYQLNKFTAATDKTGISGSLPYDLDTSSPIKLVWSGRPDTSETIEWTVRWAWVKDGDVYSVVEPAAITNSRSITSSKAVTAGNISVFQTDIDVTNMVARRDGAYGDQLWISIQPSTMTGTFALTASGMNYIKWCQGGHI